MLFVVMVEWGGVSSTSSDDGDQGGGLVSIGFWVVMLWQMKFAVLIWGVAIFHKPFLFSSGDNGGHFLSHSMLLLS